MAESNAYAIIIIRVYINVSFKRIKFREQVRHYFFNR